ncbi:intein C-terminal splicing region/intein N-terminal splicing region [Halobiforma haloterrestris]|uniref:Replication factor C small subunit n=1 Tax=Natronobacterium haloterrestre TaxID=148448 RepID=A0A1I1HL51_NATHA|nr:replication factor C small subunit [Halobiforma haloterrestris]SFC24581.1 intein C-terminal splicing region/intein N-terminal splicing region [Halobiforma haloterrestris]
MSEADAEAAEPTPGKTEVWIEKYRPDRLDEIKGHENIVPRLKRYVEQDDLPHLMFAGPAGTGKCVTGETPVLTNKGVAPISDIVGDSDGFKTPDDDLEILTYDTDGTFEYVAPSYVFSKDATDLVSIETRDGNEFTVTPEHKLLVADETGLEWREAGSLSGDERIVRPLETSLTDNPSTSLDWLSSMDGDRTFVTVSESFAEKHDIPAEENYVGQKKTVIGCLRRGYSVDEITAEYDIARKTAQNYARDVSIDLEKPSTTCSLEYLRSLGVAESELRTHVESVQYVTPYNNRSTPITPAWELTPDLARFVGLAISEARIENGRIKFYNTDDALCESFERIARDLFDVETTRGTHNDIPFVELRTKSLHHFLESCFDVFADSSESAIGSTIVHAPDDVRAAFLRSVFDSEAYVADQATIELTQKDESVITLCSYLLASFGVPTRRKRIEKTATNGSQTEQEYHALYISGVSALSRFEDAVGFTIDYKGDRLADATSGTGNPNHDTMPAQTAVDNLCRTLALKKEPLVTESLNPDTPGRESYLEDIDCVLEAAADRLETAQQVKREIDQVRTDIRSTTAVPTEWIDQREAMEPLEARKEVESTTGIRTDRLLEYADGRRSPPARRASELLVTLESRAETPDISAIQESLCEAIDALGVSDNRVAEGTELLGTDVRNLLENDDHDLGSLPRFETVADRILDVADEMCSMEVVEQLVTLDRLSRGTLYFDRVSNVEQIQDERRVYDLTVPGTRNYVAGDVPTVMHNTTAAQAIAREIYDDDWRENFLELNASDQRGIDVVRDRIKDFARSSFGGYDHRIIFLDEADALTSDAQSALRRTMEQFSSNTRFILSCNYSSQIIDPIQSRCAVFRFTELTDDAIEAQVREIAAEEGIEVTDDGVDALVFAADGDMRKAINGLQAAAVMGETVDEDTVFAITSTARPEEVEEMVEHAIDGDFTAARAALEDLLTDRGLAGGDVIDQLHRSAWQFDIPERATVRLLERLGEVDYRITTGANERLQLEGMLASLALEDEE